jgi:hypothetical protein
MANGPRREVLVIQQKTAVGGPVVWATLTTVRAELQIPRAVERLQAQAMESRRDYRFRANAVDCGAITEAMRALWTPQWPPSAAQRTLEIHGVVPDGDGRHSTFLECGEIA